MKNNFKQGKTDLKCRLCREHIEDQQSLLTCKVLNQGQDLQQPEYSDIFSEDIGKLTAITKVLHQKFENFSLHVNRQASQPSSSATDDIVISNNPVDLD